MRYMSQRPCLTLPGDRRITPHPVDSFVARECCPMANHKSAEKRHRQTLRRTEVNRSREGRIRTFLKKVELAIASGNKEDAAAAYTAAQPELHRGVNKGVLHRNTVGRKLSRLSARINAL